MSVAASYTREELLQAIRRVGISPGDVVFFHLCFSEIGALEGCRDENEQNAVILDTLLQALGPNGTLVVPTYTFSFCRRELFDVQNTPTNGGPWSTSGSFLEFVRKQPSAERSRDPIHSVCALGPRAAQLVRNIPNTCFGADSVHDRLRRMGGKICNIGVGLEEASFQHHVEESIGVPFRFKKLFTGMIRENNLTRKSGWVFNVHLLAENGMPYGGRVDLLARAAGIAQTARLGAGEIIAVDAERFYQNLARALVENPWLTAQGPAADPVIIEDARVGGPSYTVKLPADASMSEMIEELWQLPRDIISDGYDAALRALAEQLPMAIHEYPSGVEASTWIIPEKWTCHEARLETIEGKCLFSYADHPLHVVSYSLPFEGEISREDLLAHLHVHPFLPDAIPFIFKYYERDWGLCCSRNLRDSLTEERYRVRIRTSFSYGTLKVGEFVIPGASDETVVLCAHLCHPHMVNDDLSGVVVGMDVMRHLLKCRNLRYTYRFLILPETIGSISYLAANGHLVPKMVGGLFLEMLGLPNAPALQHSITPNTEVDRCFEFAVRARDPQAWIGAYREIIGNDERQFNSPGFRVPMLSLSRVLPPSEAAWPYPEYHSSHDTPAITSQQHLEDSRDLVLHMLEVFEENTIPINLFEGELFCSRYGIHVDAYENPEGNRALFRVLDLIDGTRSIAEIASACGVPFRAVRGVIDELIRNGVVSEPSSNQEISHKPVPQERQVSFNAH